jgi:hypothetical protein
MDVFTDINPSLKQKQMMGILNTVKYVLLIKMKVEWLTVGGLQCAWSCQTKSWGGGSAWSHLSNYLFFVCCFLSVEKIATDSPGRGDFEFKCPGGHGHAGRAARPQTRAHSGWQGLRLGVRVVTRSQWAAVKWPSGIWIQVRPGLGTLPS